jgi:hypothetical protein
MILIQAACTEMIIVFMILPQRCPEREKKWAPLDVIARIQAYDA